MLYKRYRVDKIDSDIFPSIVPLTFNVGNLPMIFLPGWVIKVALVLLFLQILCDLLSPAGESVKVGLRETAHNTSPHLSRKSPLAEDVETQEPVHKQHQGRAASAHNHQDHQEVQQQTHSNCAKQTSGSFHCLSRHVLPVFTFRSVSPSVRSASLGKPGAARPEQGALPANAQRRLR